MMHCSTCCAASCNERELTSQIALGEVKHQPIDTAGYRFGFECRESSHGGRDGADIGGVDQHEPVAGAGGEFWYAMEYLEGLSLADLVERYGPVPPPRTGPVVVDGDRVGMVQLAGKLNFALEACGPFI